MDQINPFAESLNRPDPEASGRTAVLRSEIDVRLDELLPRADRQPDRLHKAMRYSLLGEGKRVRPMLCILVAEAAGGQGRSFAADAGCAIEMVHTASLILDDLPSMDDAGQRRGRPTTHREFGEATSILASIGLLNRAFGIIAEHPDTDPALKVRALEVLSAAIGSDGMVAGQEIDLHQRANFDRTAPIEGLNWLKTGVLFVAAAHIGSLCARLDPQSVEAVREFAKHVGLAFQTADDLIDQTVSARTAGKDVGQDHDVPTLVTLAGTQAARHSCEDHLRHAAQALQRSGINPAGLQSLVDNIFGSRA